jgi:hypothetical protein
MCSQRSPGRWNKKRWEPLIILPSATFRQAKEIVGLLTVGLGLQVFMAVSARGNEHPHNVSTTIDIESPFAIFDSDNGILLGDFPCSSIVVAASDVGDSLMWIETVALGDAKYFVTGGHLASPKLVCRGR